MRRLLTLVPIALLALLVPTPLHAAAPQFIVIQPAAGPRLVLSDADALLTFMLELSHADPLADPSGDDPDRPRAQLGLFWGGEWLDFRLAGHDPTQLDPADAPQTALLILGDDAAPPIVRVRNPVFLLAGATLNTELRGDRPLSSTAERLLNDIGVQTRVGVPVGLPATGSGALAGDSDATPPPPLLAIAAVALAAGAATATQFLRRTS